MTHAILWGAVEGLTVAGTILAFRAIARSGCTKGGAAVNGRRGALLFWVCGNDGLTYWERRRYARRWRRGQGSLPSLSASRRAFASLSGKAPR